MSAAQDFVLAIDFGGTKVAVATAGLDGEIAESVRLDTDAPRGARQVVQRALVAARELVARTRAARGGRPLAAGAVSPGIVLDDGVLLAPNVPGWEDLSLPALLREGLALERVRVMTDVKAAALAEARWGNLRDADPGVLLSLGTGLAAAVVIDGRVLNGANGAAGEIGYMLRGAGDQGGAAHGRAPLEEAVAGRAIGERGSRLLGERLTAEQVFSSDDPRARALVSEVLAELAVHVANVAILIDPARLAVGGGLMGSGRRVLDALGARLREAVPFPPELVPARFGPDGALRGAVALALDGAQSSGGAARTRPHDDAVKGEAR
ncbi:MAG TPA: ROK family protein [Thermoleophilaceae bacterium]